MKTLVKNTEKVTEKKWYNPIGREKLKEPSNLHGGKYIEIPEVDGIILEVWDGLKWEFSEVKKYRGSHSDLCASMYVENVEYGPMWGASGIQLTIPTIMIPTAEFQLNVFNTFTKRIEYYNPYNQKVVVDITEVSESYESESYVMNTAAVYDDILLFPAVF